MAMGILSVRFYSILFPLPFYRYRIKLWLQRMRVLTRCRSHCDLPFQISSMLIFVHRRNSFSHTHFIPIRSTRPIKLARTMNMFWRISSSERIPTSTCTLYVFVRIRLSQLLPPLLPHRELLRSDIARPDIRTNWWNIWKIVFSFVRTDIARYFVREKTHPPKP